MNRSDKYATLLSPLSSAFARSTSLQWADLGCGEGVFSEVLAAILPARSHITGVDKMPQLLPAVMGDNVSVSFQEADFVHDALMLPPLDGILMANALHFVQEKPALIRKLEHHFAGTKRWIIVEYDHRTPNPWVPYPLPFRDLKQLFLHSGYQKITKTGEQRSVYGGTMYAALITNT
ncbi:trans-aconitate 2-methyltransferase [Chitinophaga sp. XS-30]|uniref:class I SAM-dependent methyltransferase n=1 Tax=Chitinophaga sp. XS-30 TaxID=2604421 RepID=UPI00143DA42F|nr:class I SAM-dependent methyltransferase [Chitinophaga sp. XS-30]